MPKNSSMPDSECSTFEHDKIDICFRKLSPCPPSKNIFFDNFAMMNLVCVTLQVDELYQGLASILN